MSYGAIGTAGNTWTGTGGTGGPWIPSIWSKEIQVAREHNLVMGKLAMRLDDQVAGGTDTLKLPLVNNLSGAQSRTIGSTASAVSVDASTPTFVTLSVNKWYYGAIMVTDDLTVQAKNFRIDLQKKKIGYDLGRQIDSDVAGLGASMTLAAQGTDAVDPSIDDYLAGIKLLDDADVPDTERYFVMSPATKQAFSKIPQFISRDYVDEMPVKTGLLGDRFGVGLYWTSNLPTLSGGTGKTNLLFHNSAFALAIQRDIQLEYFRDVQRRGDLWVGDVFYGVVAYRTDHGCIIKGKA